MTKNYTFIYHPETLSFKEYWKIALKEALNGRYIPSYYLKWASKFASKFHNILTRKNKWER